MEILVGTSGWLYKDWFGPFYPKDLKSKDTFDHFSQRFSTVEINSTFYHVPLESTVRKWYDSAPANFQFVVKLNRYLTHTKRLKPGDDFSEALNSFFGRAALLKEKLAAVLVQLPPGLRCNNEHLEHLLKAVAQLEKQHGITFPLAIEFRHASWFTDTTFELLRSYNTANVINSSPKRWPESRTITADFSYIRFHGDKELYRSSYSDEDLRNWLRFIKNEGKDCKRIYCYFNNDYAAVGVANAESLIRLSRQVE